MFPFIRFKAQTISPGSFPPSRASGVRTLRLFLLARKKISPDTTEIVLGTKGEDFAYQPGQYVRLTLIKLLETDPRGGSRDFTIASSPNLRGGLRIAFRDGQSQFKQTLLEMPLGAEVLVQGPLGVFTLPTATARSLVYIAGGIGITPFVSMASFATEEKLPLRLHLIYCNESPDRAAFLAELEALRQVNPRLTLTCHWGRLDKSPLEDRPADLADPLYYVCGPQDMVTACRKMLTRELKVPDTEIRFEDFIGYDKVTRNYKVGFQDTGAEWELGKTITDESLREALLQTLNKVALVAITDSQGHITYVNDKFVEISKYSREELIGQNHRILKSGHHSPEFYQKMWKTISSGQVWRGELRNKAKDGTFYWLDTSIAPLPGSHGSQTPAGYVAVRFPITDRKEAEQQLAQHSLFFEFNPDPVLRFSKQGLITDLNPAAFKIFGTENPIGSNLTLLIPELKDLDMARWFELGNDLAVYKTRRGSRYFQFTLVCFPDLGYGHLYSADITAQEEIQEQLQASEEQYIDLYENAPVMLASIDVSSGKIIKCNQHFAQALGYGKSELVGRSMLELYHPDDRPAARAAFQLFKRAGQVKNIELRMKRNDGGSLNALLSSTAVRDKEGNILYSRSVVEDITERKQLDQTKDEFLNMSAHELKTPLIPIKSQAQLLLAGDFGELNPEQRASVEMIFRNEERLNRLASDLLDVAQIRAGKIKLIIASISLDTLLAQAVTEFMSAASEKQVALSMKPGRPLNVRADYRRIVQVVGNLIGNAFKFTPKGGQITIEASKAGQEAVVRIRDTGIGISRKNLTRLFIPFFQVETGSVRTHNGTGLGLTIARGIVEAHQGRIWAESEGEGQGSTFHFTLPLA